MLDDATIEAIKDAVREAVADALQSRGNIRQKRRRSPTLISPAVRPSVEAQRKACADFGLIYKEPRASHRR